VQTGHFKFAPHLPTLNAVDAEFGHENEQCAARRRRQGDASMNSKFSPAQSDSPTHLGAVKSTADAATRSSRDAVIMRPSLSRRISRRVTRFVIVFCIGVSTALAWQSYGDDARAMIASSSPQLGWLAPQAASVVPTAPDVAAPAAAASGDLQGLALGLASVRQSVDQLTAQLAAGQRQIGGDIATLQAREQEILQKVSAAAPRSPAAPVRKPTPVMPPPSPPQTR
jgi:hypothetical protein